MTVGGSVGRVSVSPLTFHLLEVTLISAQDLHPAGRRMRAYAVAWARSDRKLRTRADPAGGTDPTWNDKLVFRVDDSFLQSETSAVTVDIFSSRRLRRDRLVGTVRIVVSSVGPSRATRFVALQVRRPRSLRPQGILNVGVALVDAYMHTMRTDDAAFALNDLVGRKHESRDEDRIENEIDRKDYMSRNGSRNVWDEREAEELEAKLEKWRTELTPTHGAEWAPAGPTRMSCFCGGEVED